MFNKINKSKQWTSQHTVQTQKQVKYQQILMTMDAAVLFFDCMIFQLYKFNILQNMSHNVENKRQLTKCGKEQDKQNSKLINLDPFNTQNTDGKHKYHGRHQQCQKQNEIKMSNAQVCTKYNNCMKLQLENNNIFLNVCQLKSSSQFQFPSQILTEEIPKQISIIPINHYGGSFQIDYLVQQNNQNWKKQQLHAKKIQIRNKTQRQKRLQQLFNKSKQKLKNCVKSELNIQKRLPWGHSIFNDKNQQTKIIQKQSKKKQQDQKLTLIRQSNNKSELKPINERIKQYKAKQIQKKNQNQNLRRFSDNDKKYEEIDKTKQKIQQNAMRILQEKRKQKLSEQQKLKITKSKIRAIQIQSRKSLKKFKKKPIDPNIQFKIDFIPQVSKKKKQKRNEENFSQKIFQQQTNEINNKKIQNNANTKIKAHTKQRNNKNTRKLNSKSQSSLTSQNENCKQAQNNQICQSDLQNKNSKFYIWNIPIYQDDYKIIDLGLDMTKISISSKSQKTFRQQVDQFLQNKMRDKKIKQINNSRKAKFEQQVQAKKQQYLKEFQFDQANKESGMQQAFWCQDGLYKLHPISNI